MNFQPQRVEPSSAIYWFKEGLELSVRQSWLFIVITLVFCGIHYLPAPVTQILLFVIPMLLGAGCIVAECADLSASSIATLKAKPFRVWLNLFYVGFLPWVPIFVFGLLLIGLGVEGEGFVPGEPTPTPFDGGAALLALMFFWFVTMGYWIWFVVPLVAVAELSPVIALEQAVVALDLNKIVISIVLIFAVCCLIGMISPLLVFPWVALVASMMYTSYRHIWLDRGLNHPTMAMSPQLVESE